MSSHHIVREKQEPALLILGMDAFEDELLGQLLEWSPTVITTSLTAEKINAYGIKIDLLITDTMNDDLQSDIKLIESGTDTPVEAALKYLVETTYPAVNVVTNDFQLKDFLLFADKINLVVFCGDKKIYPINSGFSKWKPANEFIELLFVPVGFQTSGLRHESDNIYRTTHDGFFTIQFNQPVLFIAEYL
ncbi:thiamine pyrophosphokinase [Mucilaginibacter segetis]|uniref:Thiamine pyrophosphokinase n=1 Tax=Mucilaginibacter segetis TaxID=2793071 RepID=A0A934PV32_9SPHI|nr:thiamine pyrophosphokinase [Mucilaginibacter segetis]MBK0380172.1 thiamine pyrophosphokinase [Mucilaginibacter segetis]